MEVKVKVLGGGLEIGKNAIEIYYNNKSLLLDYGVIFNDHIEFPLIPNIKNTEGVIVSHSHLDHTGGLPLIYSSTLKPPLYINELTLELTDLLLYDFLKISKNRLQFDKVAIEEVKSKAVLLKLRSEFHINSFYIKTFNAGHIPGSWMVFINIKDKNILYTGDFNVYESKLIKGAEIINEDVDLLICEGTYACINHINRSLLEKDLIERINETLDNGGNVLIPSFSIGRSQEILCLLYEYGIDYPIYLDGMARSVSKILLKFPEYFRDYDLLEKAHRKAIWIESEDERRNTMGDPSIIISPAGMLKGGAAMYYVKKIIKNEKNAIFFVGYLSKDTPARKILENKTLNLPTGIEKVRAKVDWFGISSHSDMHGIISFINTINPSKVLFIHCEPQRIIEMKKLLENKFKDTEFIIAENGREYQI
jgi:Predicted exonuclease of the beta-lactamase fold involved in RNA processing